MSAEICQNRLFWPFLAISTGYQSALQTRLQNLIKVSKPVLRGLQNALGLVRNPTVTKCTSLVRCALPKSARTAISSFS